MRKFSPPPMIIVLDVLFIVLFFLVLEQSPHIEIKLPQNVWLKDTVVMGVDKNNNPVSFFDKNSNEWLDINQFPSSNRNFSFFIGKIACNSTDFCQKLPLPSKGLVKKIYIVDDLYDQISGFISDSCLSYPKECVSVKYSVTDKGVVNIAKLKNDFPFFKYIL